MRIRVVPTASGHHAVQVVSKRYRELTVHRHIGTFHNDREKHALWGKAREFIRRVTGQESLFDLLSSVGLNDLAITQSRPLFIYRLLSAVYRTLGFDDCPDPVIKDLIIARVYNPTSKRETQEILAEDFDRRLALKTIYRHLKKCTEASFKEIFQKALVRVAREEFADSLRLVFYDVTTLYFESTARTFLKEFGFSKDHRPEHTQIVVGLVVNRHGFPLYFDVFSGNTFEGHTFISVVEHIRQLLDDPRLVVVADAAMVSQDTMKRLDDMECGFVVGARLASLPVSLINQIYTCLSGRDKEAISIDRSGYRLICQYSSVRAAKDRSDRLRQIAKAQRAIAAPSVFVRRHRFVKTLGQRYALHTTLIAQAEKLEGMKGYLTNTTLDNDTVIRRYHDLWYVERAFRVTKSDLAARPIFHSLDDTIKAHLVLVFASLAISRFLEIKTGMSLQHILKVAGTVLTHTVTNTKTGETAFIETTIEDQKLKEKVELLKSLGH